MKTKGIYNQFKELTVRMALSQAVKAASAAMYLALLQATPIWSGRIEVSLLLASKSLAAWYVANLAPSVRYSSQHNSDPENGRCRTNLRDSAFIVSHNSNLGIEDIPSFMKASASG